MDIKVKKRNGNFEPLAWEKVTKVLDWAAEGLDVSVSQVELNAKVQLYNGILTSDIHDMIIKSAADLISKETPDYQYMAARLLMFGLRKQAYSQYEPTPFYSHISRLTGLGKYDSHILKDYSKAEIDLLEMAIKHERDLEFAYAGAKQLEGKYLVQNRATGEVYESPQYAYMLISMCLFATENKENRLDYVVRFYNLISTGKVSLPTPIMAGVRTPTRQFSSCVLIEADDSLDGIAAASTAIIKYVSQRAGIGINAGAIRALGSEIRGGEAVHTGLIPFFKMFQAATKSCSQGAIRSGSATLFYPIWHGEVESLLVLKNNKGVEENRVRHMDYGVQINKLLYQRLIKGEKITLFSPHAVDGLYDAFFADQDKFEELYVAAENNPLVKKKQVDAVELFSALMQERANTGRIYIQNVDHCNTHGAFNPDVAPVKQSNLCMEITLPTKPMRHIHDEDGEIALCTLSAFNLGKLESLDDLEEWADLAVRALDNLLDYQDYPVKAAEISTLARRSLGVGVINYAYYLAKNGLKYDESAVELTHKTFEAIQYYLLKASNKLAIEKGACDYFDQTQYAQGLTPVDTYKKDIDSYCKVKLQHDWTTLATEIGMFGLRNSTLTALMPSETSSQISNATNGIEPPRGLVTVKQSKDGILKQAVPDIGEVDYQLLWDMPNNDGYLKLVGVMQKFVDQSISANTNYDPSKFENGKVPMKVLIKDLLNAYKYGLKTLYYHNTRDGADDAQDNLDDGCAGGACKI